MAEKQRLDIVEHDEAGNVIATFSQSTMGQQGSNRVDVIISDLREWCAKSSTASPRLIPQDSLQAFSSSIAGLLSSRAVLSSVGVGDSTASPTAALLLSILQESAGRIATILFAHQFGTSLEPECKMYRLLADVLNDIAFVLDCLSPAFPKTIRVVILSFSSVLRALCGVAAGSAKASLSAHFARWGNLGELNAKDSSQETVISLLGMLAGSLVVSWVTSPHATWATLILLLSIHLETNRRAVRAVRMRTLNRQRATLVYHHLRRGRVPSLQEVAEEEKIFERSGALRNDAGKVVAFCTVGDRMSHLYNDVCEKRAGQRSMIVSRKLDEILKLYQDRKYILWGDITGGNELKPTRLFIIIKRGASTTDVLTAWWAALAITANRSKSGGDTGRLELIAACLLDAENLLHQHREALELKGWDLDTGALEVRSSARVVIEGA